MPRGLVLLLLSCPLFAQFSHFTATDDGRQLYFISTLQLAGDPPGVGGSRIFRLTRMPAGPFSGPITGGWVHLQRFRQEWRFHVERAGAGHPVSRCLHAVFS
jgi:hypothetical protein